MTDRGEILNRSLSEIRLSPDGSSVRLLLTDSLPPYGTVVLACDNLLAFHLNRTADDELPYFIGELKWQPVSTTGQSQVLSRLGYSFLDESGAALQPDWGRAIHLHFEGSVCGDIVCGE